jgi:AraC family transcriptional regulator of adaptative response / DNA-3-methyladenine glycosylase II
VSRALRLIADGALDREDVEGLAERLGVGGRHLRRLFDAHLGVSPRALAQTQRLHFARQLVESTAMPMTEIALASGFASVRRFNGAMKDTFAASPTELRRRAEPAARENGAIALRLPFRPPLAWQTLLGFLAKRAIPGVERVEGDSYARTTTNGAFEVSPEGPRHLRLSIMTAEASRGDLFSIVARVRRLFDLDCDPGPIAAHLGRDARLRKDLRARPGLRVPGAWDAFEIGVRAILGQQVTVAGATTLAGRLVERFGSASAHGGAFGLDRVFPAPSALIEADIAKIGLPPVRAKAIDALARLAAAEPAALEDPARLVELPGIGPWTAAYVAMRAGRDPDALPATDLGLVKALGTKDVAARAERWSPWRSYAVMHLWSE